MIKYNDIEFSTVEELMKYQKAIKSKEIQEEGNLTRWVNWYKDRICEIKVENRFLRRTNELLNRKLMAVMKNSKSTRNFRYLDKLEKREYETQDN